MLSDLILIAAGLVMLLAALLVLTVSPRFDVSPRVLAALLVGAAGAWCVVRALMGPPVPMLDLLLPAGVAVWIAGAMWGRRGRPMRRASDWSEFERTLTAPEGPTRYPWAGPPKH